MNAEFSNYSLSPFMIGRDKSIQTLIHMFEQSQMGYGQIALIGGEAGIGKSRLLYELRKNLPLAQVVQGNCYEWDQTQPYSVFVDVLRGLLSSSGNEQNVMLIRELSKLFPALNNGFEAHLPVGFDQQNLKQSLTRLLIQLTRNKPLILILEDLHWCDDASLEYLGYLAQQLNNQAILLILTWRSDDVTPALTRCLATIERTRIAVEHHLASLSLTDTERMVNALLPDRNVVHHGFVEQLYRLTDGNPFFIEESLQSLLLMENETASWDWHTLEQLRIPRTVQASVQQRISLLTPNAKQVLTIAAVIGRQFDFELLLNLTGQSENELLKYLREIIHIKLVTEESADKFSFRHALTRQAVYTSLLARERRLLHSAVVDGIEQLYSGKQRDMRINLLAHHAYQGELWAKSVEYSSVAGNHAKQLYSPIAALEHYTHALLAAQRIGMTIPSDLFLSRGKMHEMVGEFEAAWSDFEEAINTSRQHQDAVTEAQGLLHLGFLWTARDYDRAGVYFQQASSVAQGTNDPLLLANILNRIGLWHTHAERPIEGLEHHAEALNHYERLHNQQGLGETLDLLGVTAVMAGDLIQGWHYFERAIALCRLTDNRSQLATLLLTASIRSGALLVDTLVWIPELEQACIRQCEEAIQIAQDIHLPATEAYARILLAHVLGLRGNYGRAINEAEKAQKIAQRIGHRMWQINAHIILGWLYLELLDYNTALYQLEQIIDEIEQIQSIYMIFLASSVLSRVYMAHQQVAKAEQVLNRVIAPDMPMQTLAQRLVWAAKAEISLFNQQPKTTLDIVDKLINSAYNRNKPTVIPRLWYLKGKALVDDRSETEAEQFLLAGYDAALIYDNRPMAWRIAVELGKLFLRRSKREMAQDYFDSARQIIEQLAGEIQLDELRDYFSSQASKHLPTATLISPRKVAKRKLDGLTKRECEVAALIALGNSNIAIAHHLTLSERTVEKHVENIMDKLGFNARTQIAVWATKKKLNN